MDEKAIAFECDRAANRFDDTPSRRGAEILEVFPEQDRARLRAHRPNDDRGTVRGQIDALQGPMPKSTARQRGERALDRLSVDPHCAAVTRRMGLFARPGSSRSNELESVRLDEIRLVAASLDPRDEPEVVQQFANLLRSGLDHPDVPPVRLADVLSPLERVGEAADRGQRRPQVMTSERYESGKAVF